MYDRKILHARIVARRPAVRNQDAVTLCVKVPAEFRRWVKVQAAMRNCSITELLKRSLEHYCHANPGELMTAELPKPAIQK